MQYQTEGNYTAGNEQSDEISLKEIGQALWRRRYTILLITIIASVIGVAIALLLPVKYESTILLSSVSDDGDNKFSGASALFAQYGGLSALGGLNFSTSSRKSEALATLQSRSLTETYIKEKNLLPILFKDDWDQSSGRWKSTDEKKIPTLWKANEFFGGIRKVTDDKKTGLITLTILWTDPKLASEWANDLVVRTNQYLRQRASEQSNRNIAYLNDQLTRTSVVELQRAIYGLIESEIKKVMIAQGSDEYAFKVIDPAVAPEKKAQPKRMLIVLAAALLGAVLSTLYVLAVGSRVSNP